MDTTTARTLTTSQREYIAQRIAQLDTRTLQTSRRTAQQAAENGYTRMERATATFSLMHINAVLARRALA